MTEEERPAGEDVAEEEAHLPDAETSAIGVGGTDAAEATARISGGGPIAYMARNGVAANLLLLFLIAAGIFAYTSLVQEVFPEFSLDTIQVSVPYPGATPDEVEESIVRKIEEQVEAVEGIDEINATAAEGVGIVSISLKQGTDPSRALDDIKAEVDRIATFPERAERPEVREITNRQSAIRLVIFGDADERTLKEVAYRTEDQLAQLPEVSFVQTSGVRDYEISIEVPQERLRSLGLTLPELAGIVRAGSLDLSAGSIETADEEVRIRTLGQNYDQQDFEEIVVVGLAEGTELRLGDIATVRDGFEDSDLVTRYDGEPAAFVDVFRTSDERVLEIVDAVQRELDEAVVPGLPAGVQLAVWENDAQVLEDRLGLLQKNAAIGLTLVLIALTLFLEIQLAFWTAVGIGVSFVGTLAVMLVLGVSINVMSLFAFILAVGIVVDDAIVVGENVYAERERGLAPMDASVRGARRIAVPVTFAVLTTMVAFSPLLFVPGTIGNILGAIPIIVMSVLGLSLVESLFILPNHLSHLPTPHERRENRVLRFFGDLRDAVDARLKRFIDGPLDRGLSFSTGNPGLVVSIGIAMIVLSVAMVPAGWVTIQFFPEVEGDIVTANLEMPQGTPVSRTLAVTEALEAAGRRASDRLADERPDGAPPLVSGVRVTVGERAAGQGPNQGNQSTALQPNLAFVQFQLLPAEDREVPSARFESVWREEMGSVEEARALAFTSSLISVGSPVQVDLSHPDPSQLEGAAARVVSELQTFQGVFDVETSEDEGLREIQLTLRPGARTLGLTLDDLARQVRAAFFGDEALRVQRGREDVRVYLRLPERERDAIADIERYYVRTPAGGEVPVGQVARVSFGRSPTSIQRKDGQRVVSVTADVDPAVVSGQEVSDQLAATILPELAAEDPLLTWSMGGEQEEQAESFGAMGQGFLLAMLVIYTLLAIPFRSYVQPLIIMAAVPFGIIGAMLAHLALGLSVGILSLFGIIGLSGVVVNGSLVMIDFINERRAEGARPREAIVAGAKARFRPILLTSITTFLGVAPLVFEQSLQAQFLIPMAASLGFGILFATAILMLLVPALAMLEHRAEEVVGDAVEQVIHPDEGGSSGTLAAEGAGD